MPTHAAIPHWNAMSENGPADGADRGVDRTNSMALGEPFRSHVADAFGFETAPATLEELWRRMIAAFETSLGRPVTVVDLCTTDQSPHRATVGGDDPQHVHFQCATDAYVFAVVRDSDVTTRTVSPVTDREIVVEFRTGHPVDVPENVWLSFGVEQPVTAPDRPVTPERMYGRLCPYSLAFAARAEYDEWAADHSAVASVAFPLGDVLELLSGLLTDVDPADPAESNPTAIAECDCCAGGGR